MTKEKEVLGHKSGEIKKLISDLPEKNLTLKKEVTETQKPKPIPSINLMKNRLLFSMKEKMSILIKSFNSVSDPFILNQEFLKIRTEFGLIRDFKSKDKDFIKKQYLRLFGYKHGIKK